MVGRYRGLQRHPEVAIVNWYHQRVSSAGIISGYHNGAQGPKPQHGHFARFLAYCLSFCGVWGAGGIPRGVAFISQSLGPNGGVATPFAAEIVFFGGSGRSLEL